MDMSSVEMANILLIIILVYLFLSARILDKRFDEIIHNLNELRRGK
jgi:hypothetical protein